MIQEKSQWTAVTKMMNKKDEIMLGRHLAYWFEKTPRRALYYASYYKFAARLIGNNRRVLDVGSGEGLGTWILAAECGYANGVDLDEEAILIAQQNWKDDRINFVCADFLDLQPEQWNAVVSFDVVEHILPDNAVSFFSRIADNLAHDGIAIIGTPNLEAQQYASDVSKTGHVNVFSYERLEETMQTYFNHVFMFCANDEIIHTGYSKLAHYLIAVGCKKK